jgi:predicted ferric reductase
MHKMTTLHAKHRAANPMYDHEDVSAAIPTTQVATVARVKTSSKSMWMWRRLTNTRINGTQFTTGHVMFWCAYIALNIMALFVSGYPIDRGLGSLAAANTIFLVMPATRNNVLTWFLALPFDKVVLHHRFVGRVTFIIVFLHFCWYFERFTRRSSEWVYWTGFAAFACGLVIVATTTDWVRRNGFNVFFWAHYSFAGFFAFAYIHVQQGRPFLMAAIGLYVLDKLLRAIWTHLPTRTIVFQPVGNQVARVRFKKNTLTAMMGKFKVGQYMFVNFPELSLTEWHPFSVSSGPGEPDIEMHIRALGDHTKEIVKLAKECAREGRQVRHLLLLGSGCDFAPLCDRCTSGSYMHGLCVMQKSASIGNSANSGRRIRIRMWGCTAC